MIELKRLLLPTDFSEYSTAATKYACALAEQFNSELHILHVLEFYPFTPGFGLQAFTDTLIEEVTAHANKSLETVVDPQWAAGRPVVRSLATGTPFVEIIRYAREHEIDMIVMATHGRSALSHLVMGNVAERVVRKASCPVLTIRPEGHQFVMP